MKSKDSNTKLNKSVNNHKTISYIIFSIVLLIILFCGIYGIRRLIEKNTDVSNAKNAIVIKDSTEMQSSFWKKINLKAGANVYILEEETKNSKKFYKVKYKNRVGKIPAEDVEYFTFDTDSEYALMSDVSKFNYGSQFNSAEDYELFLIKNDINYVYIRIGGRGYGKEGNFYTDKNNKIFIDACEYLGVPYGFYYLDEALDSNEINEEVEFIKDYLENNVTSMCKLPLAIDLEYFDGKGRSDDSWDKRADLVKELKRKFEENNIKTIIYANYLRANYYLSNINSEFWLAYYPKDDKFPESWFFNTLNLRKDSDRIRKFDDLKRKDKEDVKYNITSYEFRDKIIAWQFTEDGAKENGINEKLDLSVVNNKSFYSKINY